MTRPEEKTVLVVDDEPDVVSFFKSALEDAGFNVVTASNGFEALEQVKKKIPDFISLDLVMPEKSGLKFFYELRKNKDWQKIPVTIVTAHASDEFGKKDISEIMGSTMMSGPKTYLEKPVSAPRYVNMVKRVLGIPEDEITNEKKTKQDLASELQNMMKSADVNKLQEALDLLKKQKK
jgi:two-component system alkaline phosphatase synthesis response regulator PhoP